ncbi:hypothetical protein EHS25_008864 [Saitozyma podzolica]|uniref:V-SNARE coiled-coil homology domain-containing protein n=1 Tax=Saitozyma podzolica TaxID=1890683 RepID=A0A427YMT6_9TREE|nr:hypothetical protein EHS25_008864 [Saitozyma podzolica]
MDRRDFIMSEPFYPSAEARSFRSSFSNANTNSASPASSSAPHENVPFDPAPPYQSTAGGEVQPTPENNVQLDKIRKTQAELQEVTRLMEENIMATQQRGKMMDHLQVKTDNLAVQSKTFRTQAAVVRRKMWWKNFKWWILLTLLLILIVCGAIAGAVKGKEAVESAATATTTAEANAAALTPSGTENATAIATAPATG